MLTVNSGYSSHFIATELDLEPVIFKICNKNRGAGWTLERALQVADIYRRWLYLHILYPNQQIVPSRDIDEMWHCHILDTTKYMADCERMFNRFLHHFPYTGMRGTQDAEQHHEDFNRTIKLFGEFFGSEHEQLFASAEAVCGCTYDINGMHPETFSRRPGIADMVSA